MKIKDLRKDFIDSLSELYGLEEARSFFYLLSEYKLGLQRVNIALELDRILNKEDLSYFKEAKIRLLHEEPIQYIIGDTEFYGLLFKVNQHVLIPRPETEELVDWIVKDWQSINNTRKLTILDIGTGSGCIAISLATALSNADVYAIDVSEQAIEVAKFNAKYHEVDIQFMHSDILEMNSLPHKFDIIVSNPPYVRELEKEEIQANVLENEPSIALFVSDENPLIFYEKITALAKEGLTDTGALYFEINQYLGVETKNMIQEYEYEFIDLRKDINGNDRMIRACNTKNIINE
ncbi:peptide chain release factor N(5)-glutamine methyltransferase [uncultured Aquimarina sp.]|uniref:peptide chain release factor N(5)-glutamine methyltransferase n=1 Tax=uncultured Aquimarina sp. TaxID=575652 RepID=UPI002625C499|nr:peptide chain release factor N(5)-glutamine methyltransferase [uncultured Aquimarina sp.]